MFGVHVDISHDESKFLSLKHNLTNKIRFPGLRVLAWG